MAGITQILFNAVETCQAAERDGERESVVEMAMEREIDSARESDRLSESGQIDVAFPVCLRQQQLPSRTPSPRADSALGCLCVLYGSVG